jgi:hypothetical protein
MEVEDLQLPELPYLIAEDANSLTMLEAAKALFQESGLTQVTLRPPCSNKYVLDDAYARSNMHALG